MANKKRKKRRSNFLPIIILLLVIAIVAVALLYVKYSPSKKQMDLNEYFSITEEEAAAGYAAVVVNGEILEERAFLSDGVLYLRTDTVSEYINGRFYWDENEQVLIYTTASDTYKASVGTADYYISNAINTYTNVIVMESDGNYYINADFIGENTAVDCILYEDEVPRAVINTEYGTKLYSSVNKGNTAVRYQGGVKSDIITKVSKDAKLEIKEEFDNWYEVLTEDGITGYVRKNAVSTPEEESVVSDYTEEEYSSVSLDEKVNLTWNQVTNQTANNYITSTLAEAVGINVISPTWFYLNDNEGNINSIASSSYVTACHNKGIQVWALVSDFEDTSIDVSKVLNTTTNRERLESKLISAAIEYKLDGINVDFESIDADTVASYTQFLREMSILCRKNSIVLSVDVVTPAQSPITYDWEEMGVVCDYVILMAYDEHYSGSSAGSVASLSWTREGVEALTSYVAAEKTILGVPFYSRLYRIYSDGSVDSETKSMSEANDFMIRNEVESVYDETTEQNYVELVYNETTYQLWLEDETSMEKRLTIITDNNLAGIASWRVGYETNNIWTLISNYLS
ncbi:MAG: SH3 domain-containing protein [Eubacterium sp.]|nr:SH3 domain-containing protein [Eubacterium sp.]